ISRQREFAADALGARITGRPLALAGALRKLELGAHRIPMAVSPAVAPLAQVNPLAFSGGGVAKLFSTHPPTEERVARLTAMAAAEAARAHEHVAAVPLQRRLGGRHERRVPYGRGGDARYLAPVPRRVRRAASCRSSRSRSSMRIPASATTQPVSDTTAPTI